MSNITTPQTTTANLPDWAAGVVSINNRHYNLYGNYANTGRVFLRDDGSFDFDGQVYAPGDVLYVVSGTLVREIPQSEVDEYARNWQSHINYMVELSAKIDRTVAKREINLNGTTPDEIFGGDWEERRYPHARPGWHSDFVRYREVDAISETHDPEAILQYLVRKYFDDKCRFEPGYLHVPSNSEVTPRLQAAILAYQERGGALGRSALEALGHRIPDGFVD